jgi:hypothetical protein
MKKRLAIFIALQAFLLALVWPLYAEDAAPDVPVKQIGIGEILFAPSPFVSALEDDLMVSFYIRTRTKEGDLPEGVDETLDEAERFLSVRTGRFGFTVGWLPNIDEGLMEPSAFSVDYKYPFPYVKDEINFAADIKFSTKKLPRSDIRTALLDSGVFSITGIASRPISTWLELYGGLTANYIYLDARSEELNDLWRWVPFIGIKINPIPRYNTHIVSEVNRGRLDSSEDATWTWHLGVSTGL